MEESTINMATHKRLTDSDYWRTKNSSSGTLSFGRYPFEQDVRPFLPKDPEIKVLEVGAFPGGLLGSFAKTFPCCPDAVDFREDASIIEANMRHNGVNNCRVFCADFLEWDPDCLYDVVLSHGFLEHFVDYEAVLSRHADLLTSGGLLVLSMPHLRCYQYMMGKLLWTSEHLSEVLNTHNTEIMRLEQLVDLVIGRLGFTKLVARYVGSMGIHLSTKPGHMRQGLVPLYRGLQLIGEISKRLSIPSCRAWSPSMLLVARKALGR